jgi:hypothetical protein
MDLLLSFFFLIIASVIGITIGLLLGMRSYLKLAIFVICIFIPIELLYEYCYCDTHANTNSSTTTYPNLDKNTFPLPNSKPNEIKLTTNTHTKPEQIKYASLEDLSVLNNNNNNNNDNNDNKSPFDGLEPTELLTRLNYIYYATANPLEPINYSDYKTHADKLLDEPANSKESNCNANANTNANYTLFTHDPKLLNYSRKYYPQLTDRQIDAKDCLNDGSGKNSCFQNPSLFFNVKNDFNILTKGVNENNANLVVREDFCNKSNSMSMKMNPNTRYMKPLFLNAPDFKMDNPLDQESNETINLDTSNSMCRTCKLAVCKDDYCSLQNQLFM